VQGCGLAEHGVAGGGEPVAVAVVDARCERPPVEGCGLDEQPRLCVGVGGGLGLGGQVAGDGKVAGDVLRVEPVVAGGFVEVEEVGFVRVVAEGFA
jgi:hypothetical protein